ncbi:MAG: MraY family glycosyltransferase [Verrucomicrobiota bacterium]|nr:MraY family glycosyltransferase [Verrucomicrobiota bacterium]
MKTYLFILTCSAVTSFLLTPLAISLAWRVGALDYPSERKIHSEAMPRLGGLGVFAGFAFPWVTLYLLENRVSLSFQNHERLFLWLFIGAALLLALGIYDDIKGARVFVKLIVQIIVGFALYEFGGYRIETLSLFFTSKPLELGWFSLPVSIFWVVAITNAINLLDGVDGLVTGITALLALALAVINIMAGNIFVALVTLSLGGACLGFLPFNFSPAKVFLGDSGSLFIGLILAAVSMFSLFKETTATLIVVPLMLFGLPLFDTTSVLMSRAYHGRPLFKADKSHVHHRLLQLGLSQRRACLILYGVTGLLGIAAVALSLQQSLDRLQYIAGGMLFICVAGLAWKLRYRSGVNINSHVKP